MCLMCIIVRKEQQLKKIRGRQFQVVPQAKHSLLPVSCYTQLSFILFHNNAVHSFC